jgi:hypothetical protein
MDSQVNFNKMKPGRSGDDVPLSAEHSGLWARLPYDDLN